MLKDAMTYRPVIGSIAAETIALLRQRPNVDAVTDIFLAQHFNIERPLVIQGLATAVQHKWLHADQDDDHGVVLYKLGPEAIKSSAVPAPTPSCLPSAYPARPKSLQCGLFNDGQLVISNPGGKVTLNRDEARDLVDYLDLVSSAITTSQQGATV